MRRPAACDDRKTRARSRRPSPQKGDARLGSAFPTAAEVNPMISNMSLAHRTAAMIEFESVSGGFGGEVRA